MSKTQREWIPSAAAQLQRHYGDVTVTQKYQNFKKIGDSYVIAANKNITDN